MRVDFYRGDRLEGSGEVAPEFHGTAGVCYPRSQLFICPDCGSVWARVVVEGGKFFGISARCGAHANDFSSLVNGSIWADWEKQLIAAMPRETLVAEFWAHLRHWEEQNGRSLAAA